MDLGIKEIMKLIDSELSYLTTLDEPDFRLEQIERDPDNKTWEVVISYLVKNTNPPITIGLGGALNSIGRYEFARLYKKVKIDDRGKINGIYIYEDK